MQALCLETWEEDQVIQGLPTMLSRLDLCEMGSLNGKIM